MSVKIDISNYEQYAVDYFDGTLEGEVLEAFKAFLLCHPKIAAEFGELAEADVTLTAPGDNAPFKEELKIRITTSDLINEENYESFFALAVGEHRDSDTQRAVSEFLAVNPTLQKDYALYRHTALAVDTAVGFDGKASLKRPVPLYQNMPAMLYRAAAVLVIALGAYTAFHFVQDTTYIPRTGPVDFASLGTGFLQENVAQTGKEREDTRQTVAGTTSAPHRRHRERIEALPLRIASLTPEPEIVTGREPVAYEPIVPKIVPNEPDAPMHGRAEEYTLAQYVGKQLGIEPDQVPTTKALIREGVNKVIPRNEQFAVNAESGNNERNTFHILAGAFEFKRVTYKEN